MYTKRNELDAMHIRCWKRTVFIDIEQYSEVCHGNRLGRAVADISYKVKEGYNRSYNCSSMAHLYDNNQVI